MTNTKQSTKGGFFPSDASDKMREFFSLFMDQLKPPRTADVFHNSQGYRSSPEHPGVILLFVAAPDAVTEPLRAELDDVVERVLAERGIHQIEHRVQ